MAARSFKYPEGCTNAKKIRTREKTLRTNQDTLYYDERKGVKFNLIFMSSLVREWHDAMRNRYPELEETQQDNLIKLKSKDGTIIMYPTVKVMVHGKQMKEMFEKDFQLMKQTAKANTLPEQMGALDIGNSENSEGEGTLPTPTNTTPPNPKPKEK